MLRSATSALCRAAQGLCAAIVVVSATHADAAMMLSMDINSISATFVPAPNAPDFDVLATGTVTISEDVNSSLVDIRLDGATQTLTSSLNTVFGFVDFVNGMVVNGRLGVTMQDGSTYVASIIDVAGRVNTQAGQGFTADGLTVSGAFSNLVGGTLFAGVDVSSFQGANLLGSFLLHGFGPNANGFDDNTDLEIFVTPIPSPGVLTLAGCMGCLGLRRRR